jgi:uncharacterized phosphosugar-binding protein
MIDRFLHYIQSKNIEVIDGEHAKIEDAAHLLAQTLRDDALIFVYGSGHSHMFAEEMFYRAGGLANVYPIFIEELMLHDAAATSSTLEKQEDYVTPWIDKLNIGPRDVVIVISTSGRNATPIDVAMMAKRQGASLITISSKDYALAQAPAHSSGKYLMEIGDINIDNHAPIGDAAMTHTKIDIAFAPVSTLINMLLIESMVAEAIEFALEQGIPDIPVFKSGNVPGGKEYNRKMIEHYQKRIPILK